jgi:hypothetical protein
MNLRLNLGSNPVVRFINNILAIRSAKNANDTQRYEIQMHGTLGSVKMKSPSCFHFRGVANREITALIFFVRNYSPNILTGLTTSFVSRTCLTRKICVF